MVSFPRENGDVGEGGSSFVDFFIGEFVNLENRGFGNFQDRILDPQTSKIKVVEDSFPTSIRN